MVVSRLRAETHIRGIIPPSTRSIAEIAAGSVNIGACDGCATPADPGACRRAARSALIASTMHRSSRQASRAAVMKAVAADLIREQRRVRSEVGRGPAPPPPPRAGYLQPSFLIAYKQ